MQQRQEHNVQKVIYCSNILYYLLVCSLFWGDYCATQNTRGEYTKTRASAQQVYSTDLALQD